MSTGVSSACRQAGLLSQLLAQAIRERLQGDTAGTDPVSECAARQVDTGAGVDRLLPVQRQVVGVLGQHHLRQQRGCGQAAVDDGRCHRFGDDGLTRPAGVLRMDVALDVECRWGVGQLLADVLADLDQGGGAGGAGAARRGLVHGGDARQLRRQGLALGRGLGGAGDRGVGGRCCVSAACALGVLQRLLRGRDLLGDGLFEQATLQGAERFGPGAELDALQARHLGGEQVDPQVALLDLALLGGDALVALGDPLQLRIHHRQRCRTQRVNIGDGGKLFRRHAAIVSHQNVCSGTTLVDNRIQSTPAHSHANCSDESSHFASSERGQWKRPACSRRTHSHTPVPSISSSLIREPARLRNT